MKILVIEDHPHLRWNLIEYFRLKWHTAEWAVHGEEALTMLHGHYDVIILDMNLPIMNGETFIKTIRSKGITTPVLVLTSNALIEDKITMFDLWADDYVSKPCDMREVEARVIALSRRKEKMIEETIPLWEYTLEPWKKIIRKGKTRIHLTTKAYAILEFLARNKWYPKTKMEILDAVWGMKEAELAMNSITLEAHISMIRNKLGKSIIETMKGFGYVVR